MRSFLSALPNADLPDVAAEADLTPIPARAPDDDDFIRPAEEDELLQVISDQGLGAGRPTALAKYLIWTFGPDHPALPYPIQLRTEIEDDALISADVEVGWLHRGLEKRLEHVAPSAALDVIEGLNPRFPIAPRMALLGALEHRAEIAPKVPERARLWRMACLELERIAAHLDVVLRVLPARRSVVKRLEQSAARIDKLLEMCARSDGQSIIVLGGLLCAPPQDARPAIAASLNAASLTIERLLESERTSDTLTSHLSGRGAITRTNALRLGLTGPLLRATGFADDVRAADPYLSYLEFAPELILGETGDARERLMLRLGEILASNALIKSIFSALDKAPSEIRVDDEDLALRAGASAYSVEAPSGELSVHIIADGARLTRVRCATPSFKLASALSELLRGARLDEVVSIIASIGLSGAEVDR